MQVLGLFFVHSDCLQDNSKTRMKLKSGSLHHEQNKYGQHIQFLAELLEAYHIEFCG